MDSSHSQYRHGACARGPLKKSFSSQRHTGRRARWDRPAGPFLFFFLLCAAGFPLPANAVLVDHIVAAVNQEVITASDLEHAVALNTRLGAGGKDRQVIESETLEGLISRRLLVREARRLRFVEVTDQEISAESEKLKKHFGSDKAFSDFLAEHDMTERELSRMLGEQLLVERFIEKKIGLFMRVTREQAQKFFEDRPDLFKGKRYQDVQKFIYSLLMKQRIDQQLDQYVAELRGKADIRINPR